MAISFEESLKLASEAQAASAASLPAIENEVAVMSLDAPADYGIATLEEDGMIAAYSGEDGHWVQHPGYEIYTQFSDTYLSVVNDMKEIDLNERQFNITQEENSQYVPFEMARYYDGFDLATTSISIHYTTKGGQHGSSKPINVTYNDEKIRFGWLIDAGPTIEAGELTFEIQAYGVITSSTGVQRGYVWKTKSNNQMTVLQSLCNCEDVVVQIDDSWMQELVTDIAEKVAEEITKASIGEQVTAAQTAAQEAQDAATDAQNTVATAQAELEATVDAEVATQIAASLESYSTISETETTIDTKIESVLQDYSTTGETNSEIDDRIASNLASYSTTETTNQTTDDKIAKALADYSTTEDVNTIVDNKVAAALENYYTTDEVDNLIANIDISDQLDEVKDQIANMDGLANFDVEYDGTTMTFYNGDTIMKSIEISRDPSAEWQVAYTATIDEKISAAKNESHSELVSYQETTDADLASIHEAIDGLPETLQSDYYNKTDAEAKFATKDELSATNTKVSSVESTATTNKEDIGALSDSVVALQADVDSIDKSPRLTYEATYDTDYTYTLWEIEGEGDNEVRTPKGQFKIVGGGGSSTSSVLKIEYVTKTPVVATVDDKVELFYIFSGTDSSGVDVQEGTATWKVAGNTVATELVSAGKESSFDVTKYLTTGTQKVLLSITDDNGSLVTRSWTVQVVDVRLESNFDDTQKHPIGDISFGYTPYGAISKTVKFFLDGTELEPTVTTSASGIPLDYSLPAQEHGAHLVEAYMTAEISGTPIESNHIFKDIIWFDENAEAPVIGCANQEFTAKQYDTTSITYTVYAPDTETPTVVLAEDGEVVDTRKLTEGHTDTWDYKSTELGEHVLTITCGETVKTLKATITELGITVTPVTGGLAFDFNPVGRSNSGADRLWSDGDVAMTVSDNFDWINGGYQTDDNGDQYFCVKAGTTAVINYNLFADDAKANGKEFKAVFKTTNIKKRDTSFLSCMNGGIGLDMRVESANIYSSNGSLYSPYCEEDIIEFEFNINKSADIPLVLTYEDGVGNRPMIYSSDASFWQTTPQPITIGSEYCDVHIYRMKAYKNSLSDSNILSNFIADARNADEMIARHNRNQIYDENSALVPEVLAEKCPDLRIIMLDAPYFTNDKDNKIDDTIIRMIYKNGDPTLDNWTCTGARHSGQGTSSNEYGYSARNIDLIMDRDTSLFTLGDNSTSKTITLTRTSVPTDYLNLKVNVASSENQNNAQMARRYNQYNPFVRSAKFNDSKVKDCMEFYNCVLFIRERNEDITTHREFKDTNYHFYAIGNIGDSKKTDDTRVNDKSDPKECILEITDYNVPLAEFPTGSDGICSEDAWVAGNTAYDLLYAAYKYKEGEFKSFGAESYEFRYEMDGITEEQREVNINAWRDFYKFVVTSSDKEFYNRLKEYFVVDSALYYYLFTERYTMVDNRAKNSFWHYGKVYIAEAEAETLGDAAGGFTIDDAQAAINEGYRWDLAFGYDFDTALGIDNTGKLVLTYGKEDVDYYVDGDPSSGYIYRAAESTFFCRLRDLFASELQGMFVDIEEAWSATSLINQWDEAQAQFPEELWRLDIQRKYLRTYLGTSIDNSIEGAKETIFLPQMMNGRKKYQRRMFDRNQELYMATKYFGTTATQDQIRVRFNNPETYVVAPDFTLYLTPYSDMYIGVQFGNVEPVNFRAKAGVEYAVPYSIETDSADITLIYGASFIQAIGDLSKCYIGDNDFSNATRLQSLTIGSNIDGYANNFMTTLSLGNNKLLEYLDIRNVTGLSSPVNLSSCGNLIELRAEGSGATGVIFANGGKVERFYIPDVTSLTIKNLNYLQDYEIAGYKNLQSLVVENTPTFDAYQIVDAAIDYDPRKLGTMRLIGIDWVVENTSILDVMMTMRGKTSEDKECQNSIVSGNVYTTTIKEQDYVTYSNFWPDLEITYGSLRRQYPVTFKNDDGTTLETQYVVVGETATDISRYDENENPTYPIKESTAQYDYRFSYWTINGTKFDFNTKIGSSVVLTAFYEEVVREYEVKYLVKSVFGTEEKYKGIGKYGTLVSYAADDNQDGIIDIPTYVAEEVNQIYYLFRRWDKSGFVDGDKTINAIYDIFEYDGDSEGLTELNEDVEVNGSHTVGSFKGLELNDLSPVQIYALTKLSEADVIDITQVLSDKDEYSFVIGNDFDYDDIESKVLIDKKTTFNGISDYIDTGIALFDEDRDFVLAIDYEFLSGCAADGVLAQCFHTNNTSGFMLQYNSQAKIIWGNAMANLTSIGKREIIVIRHQAGNNNLMVYNSSLDADEPVLIELERTKSTIGDGTLVFGCIKAADGIYESFGTGNINWCKLWYRDLGDQACRDLAMWTHEKVTLRMSGFRRYYLADDSARTCTFSVLASHLLDRIKPYNRSGLNSGGWATSDLNWSLNNRLYQAFPLEIRNLTKKVLVRTSIGDSLTEIGESACHITIPSYIDVIPEGYSGGKSSQLPYNRETSLNYNKTISHMTSDDSRKRGFANSSDAEYYWLRSPDAGSLSYVWQIAPTGKPDRIHNANGSAGVLIEISF